ncbi:MAG: PLP-dependent aminotransferase family protein [Bacillota bacterium]
MKCFEEIQLDKESAKHLYVQLYEKIRDLICEGSLAENEKLPPIRQMADLLNVNNVTIVNAYDLLEKEGFVYKKIGSGTYIAPIYLEQKMMVDSDFSDDDIKLMDRGQMQIKENMLSFASATPTPDMFPVEDFKILLNEVLDRDGGNAFGYQESQGYYPLRESLVDYLEKYDIMADPEDVQIISGAQQGIDVISKALVGFGDSVIVESPTYTGAIATLKSRGAKIIDIPIQEDGIDIEALETCMKEYHPKMIYLMPNFQNPTGCSYSLEKKQRVLELAYKYNILIVEDDYLSDLNFYSDDNSTLKSHDRQDAVIYIKSFSKIFMPGLRLGFLVIPQKLKHKILAAKHASDISTSGLNQRAFDLYLRKGIWKKHILFMENIYKERFDLMHGCIEKYIVGKGIHYHKPKGGLNFWLCLPKGYSSNALYTEAVKNSIVFVPGSIFFSSQTVSNCFRISIAGVYPKDIEKGVKKLADTIDVFLNKEDRKGATQKGFIPLL